MVGVGHTVRVLACWVWSVIPSTLALSQVECFLRRDGHMCVPVLKMMLEYSLPEFQYASVSHPSEAAIDLLGLYYLSPIIPDASLTPGRRS